MTPKRPVHGKAVFEELCQVVEEAMALDHTDGKPLPPRTLGQKGIDVQDVSCADHCAEILASFTTRANFAISDLRYSPNCSGVPPMMTAPTAACFSWMSGSLRI
jgi:hypothetical protein